jgi:uncharacterized protein YkwD
MLASLLAGVVYSSQPQVEQLKQEVFAIVNEERASANVPPLCFNRELGITAQSRSCDQQSCSKMSHAGCNGSSKFRRTPSFHSSQPMHGLL